MKIIIAFLICCFLGSSWAQSCHLRELDLCAATLLVFTQNPSGIATTDNELNKQCGYLREADSCLRNFTRKCTTPLQRELIGFVTEGSMRLLNEYCTSGTQLRQSYLKHAPCLNQAQRGQRTCVKDLQSALEIVTSVEWDRRIPAGCCAYRRFQGCTENLVESKCGKEAVEFMNILLRMALSRLPDIVCQGYGPSNPECRSLLPPPGTPPKGARSNSVLSRLFSAYTGLYNTGTDQEIDRQCGFIRDAQECRRNYTTRCATPLQKDLVDFIGYGADKAADEFCTHGTDLRNEYKKHAKCIGDNRQNQKECRVDFQAATELMTSVDVESRIPTMCCAFNRFYNCVQKSLESSCGEDAVKVVKRMLRLSASRLPEIVCKPYPEDSKRCISLLPPPGSAPTGAKSNSLISRIFAAYFGNY